MWVNEAYHSHDGNIWIEFWGKISHKGIMVRDENTQGDLRIIKWGFVKDAMVKNKAGECLEMFEQS